MRAGAGRRAALVLITVAACDPRPAGTTRSAEPHDAAATPSSGARAETAAPTASAPLPSNADASASVAADAGITCFEPAWIARADAGAPAAFAESAGGAAPGGSTVRLLPNPVVRDGQPRLVARVEAPGRTPRTVEMFAPAGGSVDVTLSRTGAFVVWSHSRSGPLLTPVAGGKAITLPWGSILSPDDTFVLEPAHAHGFTNRLEHGREVRKLALSSGKERTVARVPPEAVPLPQEDDAMVMNERTAVAIAPDACIYATTQPRELVVYRARDDAPLAIYKDPGPVRRLDFDATGRFLRLSGDGGRGRGRDQDRVTVLTLGR